MKKDTITEIMAIWVPLIFWMAFLILAFPKKPWVETHDVYYATLKYANQTVYVSHRNTPVEVWAKWGHNNTNVGISSTAPIVIIKQDKIVDNHLICNIIWTRIFFILACMVAWFVTTIFVISYEIKHPT